MADEWDDDVPTTKPITNVNTAKYKPSQNDDWDDAAPAKPQNTNRNTNSKPSNDDDWNDDPKPTNNRNTNNGASNDDWGDEPATKKSNGWDSGKSKVDGWGNDSSAKKPFGNRNNNDRGPRKPDWICSECSAKVFGSRSSCFKCNADKGDSKDAPPDDGSSSNRSGRPSDWICSECSARVFGNKTSCFKCNADKGDSKDAPPDDGKSRGRANDWICDNCQAKVFGSKTTCFKCQADKGDSKDAPTDGDDGGSKSGDGGGSRSGGRPGDWTCSCGVSNFASRNECYKCSEAKPEGAGGSDVKFNNEANKEFYIPTEIEESDLFNAGISSGINFTKYKDIPVKITDDARKQAPKAATTFKECGLNDYLLKNIERSGYTIPTPIQQNAIPTIMAGRDLMACAQTGSGKTAAFLLPMIHKLMADNAPPLIARPYVVIVTPTRELCTQIYNEARKFAQGSIIKCGQLYGGTAVRHQNSNLNSGVHVLVATPGRLKDFCDKTYITFENLRYFVLDEADRMLDMGFAPAVEEIMKNPTMPATGKRQTLMFSATFPNDIQRLAGKYLYEYIFLTIGIVGGACQDVEQTIYEVSKFKKRDKLMELLNAEDPKGTMVFVETKRTADFLASFLSESEHPTTSIHGDRKQSQREEALSDFKSGKMKVIIATSVAARGLDIPKVRHVINYDIPKSIDDYVHRIGRTGRVGNVGKATSFFDPEQDSEIVNDLVKILENAKQTVPGFLASGGGGGGGNNTSSGFGGVDFRSKSAAPPAHGGDDDDEWN